jgi:hypothetical protein
MTRHTLEGITGIVAQALSVLQEVGNLRPDAVEPINAAILVLAEHASDLQAERDELLEALTEATNKRREAAPEAQRLLSTYLQERGKYRDAGDLECQLDEAVGDAP